MLRGYGFAAVVTLAGIGFSAHADDVMLEFDFLTHEVDESTHMIGRAETDVLEAGKTVGFATFADGRRAMKKTLYVSGPGIPPMGVASYIFENEDSITATFTLESDNIYGTYKVVSGTGAYDGVTGTGTFKLEGYMLDSLSWSGTFSLTIP